MFLNIFTKMKSVIENKLNYQQPGLYVSLLFPIIIAFLLTFIGSRIVGYLITYGYMPQWYWEPSPGLHVHHFTYGFFILAIAGYLGLIFSAPKAKFYTALLLGFGLGLAIDEFGMWLRLSDDDVVRWSYDGFTIIIGTFLFLITVPSGWSFLKQMLFSSKRKPEKPSTGSFVSHILVENGTESE